MPPSCSQTAREGRTGRGADTTPGQEVRPGARRADAARAVQPRWPVIRHARAVADQRGADRSSGGKQRRAAASSAGAAATRMPTGEAAAARRRTGHRMLPPARHPAAPASSRHDGIEPGRSGLPYAGDLKSTITGITPSVVTATAGDLMTVTGTVTNVSKGKLYDLRYVWQRGDALSTVKAIKAEIADPEPAVGGDRPGLEGAGRQANRHTAQADLAAGATHAIRGHRRHQRRRWAGARPAWVYPLMIKVSGDIGQNGQTQYERVGEIHLLATVLSVPPATAHPSGTSSVVSSQRLRLSQVQQRFSTPPGIRTPPQKVRSAPPVTPPPAARRTAPPTFQPRDLRRPPRHRAPVNHRTPAGRLARPHCRPPAPDRRPSQPPARRSPGPPSPRQRQPRPPPRPPPRPARPRRSPSVRLL